MKKPAPVGAGFLLPLPCSPAVMAEPFQGYAENGCHGTHT